MNRLPLLHGNGFTVSRDLNPKLVSVDPLKPLGRQTRKHRHAQIRKLGESLMFNLCSIECKGILSST